MKVENKVIEPYTLMAMVGPSGSGKSHWVNQLKIRYPNLKVVSSDEERYQLLDINPSSVDSTYRYSQEMLEVSESAFHILKAKVEAHCKLGSQHILVDTTGTPTTIEMLSAIAEEYAYKKVVIVMSLSNKEMSQYAPDRKIYERSLNKFQQESVRSLKGWERLDIKDRETFPSFMEDVPLYLDTFSVIGDMHQRLDLVTSLLSTLNEPLIYLGDYFDVKEDSNGVINNDEILISNTLSFLEEQINQGSILLKGNHENYIYYRLTGGKPCDIEPHYFNSVPIFLSNEDLKNRFLHVYTYMKEYALVKSRGTTYYLSHAPCPRKYRCKPGYKQNYKFSYNDENLYEQLSFLQDGAPGITINGHISHNGDTLQPFRNRYLIDTGSTLTSLICSGNSITPTHTGPFNKTLPSLLPPKELSPELAIRVDRILSSGSRFISGTMSPAPSLGNELESLEAALSLFTSKGINQVLLDKKEMGSRCTASITEDKVLMTSRSGLPIKGMEHLHPYLQSIRQRLIADELVLDGELMPWSTLGEGLVQEYESKLWIYEKLKERGIDIEGVDETKQVLSNYSSREEPYYIPFSILEMKKDGVITYPEWDMNTNEIKQLLQVDPSSYLIIDTSEIDKARLFFNEITSKGFEGIVIKPLEPKDKNKIPYMKVRGRDYLRLVYGPDYMSREASLAKSRNVKKKVELSRKEWLLGKEMLTNEGRRRELMVDMLGYVEQEQLLDPRL